MTDKPPMRLGVIGAGAISQVVHLPILVEREDVDVVAIADLDMHKAETLSRRFSVPLVLPADELLDLDDLDAVVLCTPNNTHEEMAIAALERGLHVFVERPLATSSDGASRAVEVAVRQGRVLLVGFPHRYRPEVIALRSFHEGGELGEPYAVRASWLTRLFPSHRASWRSDQEVAGGGVLVDLGVPALDMALFVLGYPEARRVLCVTTADDDAVEHSATLMIELEGGIAVTLEVGNRLFASEDRFYLRVMGSEGSGSLPPLEVFKQLGGRPMEVTPRQPRPRGGENPYTNAYRRLLDDFVRQASGVGESSVPVEQVALMRVIEAAYASAQSGREVDL